MVNHYGYTDPSEGRGALDGTAYKDGMEYAIWGDADGWTMGACHEVVGLMSYWSGETRESLIAFANICTEYVETEGDSR